MNASQPFKRHISHWRSSANSQCRWHLVATNSLLQHTANAGRRTGRTLPAAHRVPLWPSAKRKPEQSEPITPFRIWPFMHRAIQVKCRGLYQTQELRTIFQISHPLYGLHAWASEVRMSHPKSFPAQYANLAKKAFKQIVWVHKDSNNFVFSFSHSAFCRIKRD